jgi:Rrf2 family protein
MLSLTCKTAIKAVIYLAAKSNPEHKIGIKDIALHINASEHTIGKTLQVLTKQKLIISLKGPSGGFYLNDTQKNLAIYKIIEAIEGKGVFKECGLGLSKCSETHPCPIHNEYKVARELMDKLFREKKVIDLCDPVTHGLAFLMD